MKKAWLAIIKEGFFTTWSGLTYELVSKFLPVDIEETAADHLHENNKA